MEDAAVERGTAGKLRGRQVSVKDEVHSSCRLGKDRKSIRIRLLPVFTDYFAQLRAWYTMRIAIPLHAVIATIHLISLAEPRSAIVLLGCTPCLVLPNRLLLKINSEEMPFL